jgi:GTP cyclohydrolase II
MGEEYMLIKPRQVAEISFPTRWAHFRLFGFEGMRPPHHAQTETTESALALVLGNVHNSNPLVRIHSQCTTGDVFHSLRCDCHDQLHLALQLIAQEGAGMLLYEHQEGRGIGLMEKLKTYELQEAGLDTIEANLHLGHAADLRDYRLPIEILHFFKVSSVRLITNNPQKISAVTDSGILVTERIGADVPGTPHSARYLATKRDKMGHLFERTERALDAERTSHRSALVAANN